jgi:hypothetical protein
MAAGLLNIPSIRYDRNSRKGGKTMIRAVYRDGMIQPLDPLPEGWNEGQELQITESEPSDDPEEIERWWSELTDLMNQPHDPEDMERLESALAEADRLAKDQVRKEMRLD